MTAPRAMLSCLFAFLLITPAEAAEAAIRLAGDKAGQTIEVTGLDAKTLSALARLRPDDGSWRRIFPVRVESAGSDAPAMLGTYRVEKDVLRFIPRFPLARGVRYRVVYNPAGLPDGAGKPVETVLSLPRPASKPTAVVTHVYPSTDRLPENQLKFYLHFSVPMSQGNNYRHIKLLDARGKAIDLPFLELDQELWDRSGTRFTLFFDPGRIKRGLKPREEVGPALEEGKSYTLVIESTWQDAEGNPMKAAFRKSFRVGAPDDTPPDTKTWKVSAPSAGTRQPLRLTFPKPMDHALLQHLIWVTDAKGKTMAGKVVVLERETVWTFTPESVWGAGNYEVVVDRRLEDLAGNSIGRPFEVDILRPVDRKVKTETVKVPFSVKK